MTDPHLLAILLGSDAFPLMPGSFSKGAFAASAQALKNYLQSPTIGLGLHEDRILDLFSSEDPIERQDARITRFLIDQENHADTLIIYYVGHGGFLSDRQYFLAVKNTDPNRRHFTGLKARDLAETLKNNASGKKIYLILDCCFAGAAVDTFQSDEISTMVEEQTYDSFPALGTALFAASSRNEPAIAPHGGKYTMMSEALLSVLAHGVPTAGDLLSLRDVAEATASHLRMRYGLYAVRPEVHTPRQINHDIADVPIFPNQMPRSARTGTKSETRIEKYNSDLEALPFSSWTPYISPQPPGQTKPDKAGALWVDGFSSYNLETSRRTPVGTNKIIEMQGGLISFNYKIVRITQGNIAFYAIPMRYGERMSPGRQQHGCEVRDPSHAGQGNPLRLSFRPSPDVDGDWQYAELRFDFSHLGPKIFTIFAPRINEGQTPVGVGHVVFAKVRIFALEQL